MGAGKNLKRLIKLKNMVDAKELRIGNLVYAGTDENDKQIMCEVEAIDKGYISWEGNKTNLEYVDGVPLTPELLEKCGFGKIDTGFANSEDFYWSIQIGNQLYLNCSSDLKNWMLSPEAWNGDGCEMWKGLTYLHEVQNLFYFTANEELTIQLI